MTFKQKVVTPTITKLYLEKYRGLARKYPDRIAQHIERAENELRSLTLGREFGESTESYFVRRPDVKKRWDEIKQAILEMGFIPEAVTPGIKREATKITKPINLESQLAKYQAIRFKTANDEKQITRLQKLIKADASKWQVGQGVGWEPTGVGQVNRGYRIIEVHPETKEVTVQAVTDVGQLADFTFGPHRVEISDLVRDRRFDSAIPKKTRTYNR